jgi:hypothetical protein
MCLHEAGVQMGLPPPPQSGFILSGIAQAENVRATAVLKRMNASSVDMGSVDMGSASPTVNTNLSSVPTRKAKQHDPSKYDRLLLALETGDANAIVPEATAAEEETPEDPQTDGHVVRGNQGDRTPRDITVRAMPAEERLRDHLAEFRDFKGSFEDLEKRCLQAKAEKRRLARSKKQYGPVLLSAEVKETRGEIRACIAAARAELVRQKHGDLRDGRGPPGVVKLPQRFP